MTFVEKMVFKAVKAMVGPIWLPDLTSFNDPLAARTGWKPLKQGGARFRSVDLVETGPGRFESRRSVPHFVTSGFCVVLGLGILYALGPLGVVFGVPWVIAGVAMGLQYPRIAFDAARRQCTLGKESVPFVRIHALQLLEELVTDDEGRTFSSYELNLVMKDASRLNVRDHGQLELIEKDAERIAAMIGCPIWNGVKERLSVELELA